MSETEERVTQKLTDTVQNVNDSLSDTTTTLAKKVADAQKQLEDGRTAMQQSAASLNSRMNSIASGKTTDKETLDARSIRQGRPMTHLVHTYGPEPISSMPTVCLSLIQEQSI